MKSKNNPNQGSTPGISNAPCVTHPQCPIVALGASAGGLEVFGQFFEKMPADTGLAFVLLQHLDRGHETLMPALLSKHTSMRIVRAEDGVKVQPNQIYVIGHNASLTMENCTLRVELLPARADSRVIDGFFRSAAQDQKHNFIGIVLSGTGTDGTLGLKAIKEHGGLTIVQQPETAKFDGMPRNAVSSGFADFVLPLDEIPARVLKYIEHAKFEIWSPDRRATIRESDRQAGAKLSALL